MEAPKSYKDAGLMNLIAGILNIITAGVWTLSLIWLCVGIVWLIPLGVGAYQAYLGFQMQSGTPNAGAKNIGLIGLIAGVCNFNIFAIVLSVLAMQKAKEPEVAGYLSSAG
jgi:hypothetical protein